jgi:pimeloyl-ACP methyl ester carboxylesterase
MELSFDRTGNGGPLLLIHGTGGSRRIWKPVVDRLAEERDVIAVDLPGHGESPVPPADIPPTPPGYARVLLDTLHGLGLESAHAAGYSVGGWTALELAKLGGARSVVAFGPAGLWRKEDPRTAVFKLWLSRRLGRRTRPLARRLVRSTAGRKALLSGEFARPERIPPDEAIDIVETYATAPGFDAHLAATRRGRFTGGKEIDVPVTIAFGERDRLLSKRKARSRDELPEAARWIELEGCGHVPTWDDPELVARTILEGTSAEPARTGAAT